VWWLVARRRRRRRWFRAGAWGSRRPRLSCASQFWGRKASAKAKIKYLGEGEVWSRWDWPWSRMRFIAGDQATLSRPGLTPTLSDQLSLRVCSCAPCIETVYDAIYAKWTRALSRRLKLSCASQFWGRKASAKAGEGLRANPRSARDCVAGAPRVKRLEVLCTPKWNDFEFSLIKTTKLVVETRSCTWAKRI